MSLTTAYKLFRLSKLFQNYGRSRIVTVGDDTVQHQKVVITPSDCYTSSSKS